MLEILIGLLLEFLGEVVGALVGLVSVWILPRRIFPATAHLSGIRARWLAVAR